MAKAHDSGQGWITWVGQQVSGTCNETKMLRFYLEGEEALVEDFKLNDDMIE